MKLALLAVWLALPLVVGIAEDQQPLGSENWTSPASGTCMGSREYCMRYMIGQAQTELDTVPLWSSSCDYVELLAASRAWAKIESQDSVVVLGAIIIKHWSAQHGPIEDRWRKAVEACGP